MNSKYYFKTEEGVNTFLEISADLKCEYIEFSPKIIKYRFLDAISTEDFLELGYYSYKRELDKQINNL